MQQSLSMSSEHVLKSGHQCCKVAKLVTVGEIKMCSIKYYFLCMHIHWRVLAIHQGREIIAIGALENGAFCTVFSENFHKF